MVWFVTGASSGIGAGAVKAALAAGDRVVAIARNTDKLTKAVGKESESLVHAALDVRNAGQVREAVATALETDDAQGASVVLGARRVDRIQSLADELTGRGGKALAVTTDVTQRDQVQKLVDAAVQTYGRIDVMINNAGLMPQALLEPLKIEEWDRMIGVNIKGVLYGIAAALPYMKQQKAGHFINVSSVAGHRVGPGFAVYAATKYAVRALSEGLRQEVKPYNVRTTVISPGAVATELPQSVTDPDAAVRIRKFYAEIAIPADPFARAVAFAISQLEEVDVNEILFRPTRQEL